MTINPSIQHCYYCQSKEGEKRAIGNYIVELKPFEIDGQQRMACQSCGHKAKNYLKTSDKKDTTMNFIQRMKKMGLKLFSLVLFVLVVQQVALAQGTPGLPGFPSTPDPTPIDGGLGLLAAAGGAYAIKKLRGKKAE